MGFKVSRQRGDDEGDVQTNESNTDVDDGEVLRTKHTEGGRDGTYIIRGSHR